MKIFRNARERHALESNERMAMEAKMNRNVNGRMEPESANSPGQDGEQTEEQSQKTQAKKTRKKKNQEEV